MKWVRDPSGRFQKRPHYLPEELDAECEQIVTAFLLKKYGQVVFPVSTNDLTILLEREAESLDQYADFSGEEGDVEGMTQFRMGQRPLVSISAKLTQSPHLENRLRTTLTHEYAHVRFHNPLYQVECKPASLFQDLHAEESSAPQAHRCNRDSMTPISQRDWMEWQAGYVCGAMLIPRRPLEGCVSNFRIRMRLEYAAVSELSQAGSQMISEIAKHFQTSQDAARVRLLQKNILSSGERQGLF